jgi:septum formation protein
MMTPSPPLPEILREYRLVLASDSPRRRELIRGLGWEVVFRAGPGIKETYPAHLRGEQIAGYLAYAKAKALHPAPAADELVLTADTVVWFRDQMLPKPQSRQEAREILKTLSGHTHSVITGVCILVSGQYHTFTSCTKVTFGLLKQREIDWYVDRYQPYDKAGAYGIQEWIGMIGVEGIEGSYFNVMGLPVQHLYRELITIKPQ